MEALSLSLSLCCYLHLRRHRVARFRDSFLLALLCMFLGQSTPRFISSRSVASSFPNASVCLTGQLYHSSRQDATSMFATALLRTAGALADGHGTPVHELARIRHTQAQAYVSSRQLVLLKEQQQEAGASPAVAAKSTSTTLTAHDAIAPGLHATEKLPTVSLPTKPRPLLGARAR